MTKLAPINGSVAIAPHVLAPGGVDISNPLLRPESIQRHLEKVVISAEMCRSKKLCQFLRFTVEEVLRGHGAELKEYAIAVGVFRRGRDFDPGADPIVRVQARRLRSKLAQYYQMEGCEEPLRIEYPVGSYSPIFTRRAPPAIHAKGGTPARQIAVLPFAVVGAEASEAFGDGLTDELIHTLSSWPGVRVVARTSCFQFKGRSEDVRRIGEWLGVCALISGSVRIEASKLRVMVQLVDAATGLNLWSGRFDHAIEGILATQHRVSCEIVEILQLQLPKIDPSGGGPTTM